MLEHTAGSPLELRVQLTQLSVHRRHFGGPACTDTLDALGAPRGGIASSAAAAALQAAMTIVSARARATP